MNDLISRQDALDALDAEPEVWIDDDEYTKGMNAQWKYDRKAIEALPSAERWIPCSEMTPEKFKNEMQKISDQLDKNLCYEEITHSEADGLMCDLLRELGYGEGVDVFEDMPKWYA